MAKLEWNDPRMARSVQQMVSRAARQEIARQMPQRHYGTVRELDFGARTATLRFVRASGFDDVQHVAWGDFTPRIGQRVCMVRWPDTGDVYIERADGEDVLLTRLTELGLIPEAT